MMVVAKAIVVSVGLGVLIAALLVGRSLGAFSQTGPQVRKEVLQSYRLYSIVALMRLAFWACLVVAWVAMLGELPFIAWNMTHMRSVSWAETTVVGIVGIVVLCALQFAHQLLWIPSSIVMSSNYKVSRFYTLWKRLSITRIRWVRLAIAALIVWPVAVALTSPSLHGTGDWFALACLAVVCGIPYVYAIFPDMYLLRSRTSPAPGKPNIVMIGCDTLRVDRLGGSGYSRPITPFLDVLSRRGTAFVNCYTPIARTAPSLASLFTGTWPATHGIRDNFVSDEEAKLDVPSLAGILARAGYRTVSVSDWAGSDFNKLELGFESVDVPPDQWNLRYLIRQGPKDIRLFLSLFAHNRVGKRFLPEIYYLAGVPLTKELGAKTCAWLAHLAGRGEPFLLNVFMATSHPPFGSEYPYYTMFTPTDYAGESKFAMARLVDPFDVIRSMQEPREAFELEQIIDLYDSCVRRFDDEVRLIGQCIEKAGIADNTIVVVYSDHGMELFEHDTWGQGNSAVGEASPRVPLIVVDPRRKGVGLDERVVRTVDLLPTLLDCCGIAIPESVEGASLRDYMVDKGLDKEFPAYFETGIWLAQPPGQDPRHLRYPGIMDLLYIPDSTSGTLAVRPEYQAAIIAARDRMVRVGDWKLVRFPLDNGIRFDLFDLRNDPRCTTDVAKKYPNIVQRLEGTLAFWLKADHTRYSGTNHRGNAMSDHEAETGSEMVGSPVVSSESKY
jgi:arylsulfatase A-like enzyme